MCISKKSEGISQIAQLLGLRGLAFLILGHSARTPTPPAEHPHAELSRNFALQFENVFSTFDLACYRAKELHALELEGTTNLAIALDHGLFGHAFLSIKILATRASPPAAE
jgi:hypothetical protein